MLNQPKNRRLMKARNAVSAVRAHLGNAAAGKGFQAELDEGRPDLWYVTYDSGGYLVGGDAYIVSTDGEVFEVPASVPPDLNLSDVRKLLALNEALRRPQ